MQCVRCGNSIAANAAFCGSCGEPRHVDNQPKVQKFSTNNLKKAGIITLIFVVVLSAGLICYANAWRIMPAKAYYGIVESFNKMDSINKIVTDLNKTYGPGDIRKSATVTVTGATGNSFDSSSIDVLKSTKVILKADFNKNNKSGTFSSKALYEDTTLMDFTAYVDKDKAGIQIPVIYDKPFIMSTNNMSDIIKLLTGINKNNITNIKTADYENSLDTYSKLADYVIDRYSKIIYDTIPQENIKISQIDKSNTSAIYTFSKGRKSNNIEIDDGKLIEITLAKEDIAKIMDNLIKGIESDKKLKDDLVNGYIEYKNYYNYLNSIQYSNQTDETPEDLKVQAQDGIDNAIEQMKSAQENFANSNMSTGIVMTLIVDNSNKILNRDIQIKSGSGMQIQTFRLSMCNYKLDNNQILEVFGSSKYSINETMAFDLYSSISPDSKEYKVTVPNSGTIGIKYTRSDPGANKSGVDYGRYLITGSIYGFNSMNFSASISNSKSDDTNDKEYYDVKVGDSSNMNSVSLSLVLQELNNDTMPKFNFDNAVDLDKISDDKLIEVRDEFIAGLQNYSRSMQDYVRTFNFY